MNPPHDEAQKNASHIVVAYGRILEDSPTSLTILFRPESDLPYPKSIIRSALELLLLTIRDAETRKSIEACDVLLNRFLPQDEYCVAYQQRAGLAQAVERFKPGVSVDITFLKPLVTEGATKEGEERLAQIVEQWKRECDRTVLRHQEIRRDVELVQKSGEKRGE